MYDDAWYSTFVSGSQPPDEKPQIATHRQLTPLTGLIDPRQSQPLNEISPAIESIKAYGPPEATVLERAKSYSDFYDAVAATLDHSQRGKRTRRGSNRDGGNLRKAQCQSHGLDEAMLAASQDGYRIQQDNLLLTQSYLESITSGTLSTLDLLSSVSSMFKTVEVQSTAFRSRCHAILADQERSSGLSAKLRDNVQYYDLLEPITRRLNNPSAGKFVGGVEFQTMLTNLDNCLQYMRAHPEHREAQTYQSRYRLLMTRALTLVRLHFVNSLRDIATDAIRRIADRQLNETTMSALLYGKFKVDAKDLKQTGEEIRKRTDVSPDGDAAAGMEYQSLMNELYQSYSSIRGKLILPIVQKRIGDIAMAPSTSTDLVAFARTSIAYVKGVCVDEFGLWGEWFDGEQGLYEFLELVCEPLYDHLRPRIIHETQLQKLCELCILLQSRYMHSQEDDEVPEPNELDFSYLIQAALEDAQTRLVFRAQNILRDEIENYRPTAEDLNYPACLQGESLSSNKAMTTSEGLSRSADGTQFPRDPADGDGGDVPYPLEAKSFRREFRYERAAGGGYPTLRTAIQLLSRIYRLVNSSVFDDLAHQIVHQTTQSLHQAAQRITTISGAADGQLFLVKHLLLLKSQIMAYDIEFVTPEVSFDFSTVTSTFSELRSRGGLFNPKALVRFISGGMLPRVVESMLDAKAELDGRLRVAIYDFTNNFTSRMTAPLPTASTSSDRAEGETVMQAVRHAIEQQVPLLRRKLEEYLPDVKTRETLVAAVREQVVQSYETYVNSGEAGGRSAGAGPFQGRKGKARVDQQWDPTLFAEWTEGIFHATNASLDGEDSPPPSSRGSMGNSEEGV
ncbi:MAG: Golgi transport complex subunit 3 [Caeruleum heppii]|nr:MAG: Golgi transport complex subunit 3 [Caeruleum heppii]